MKSELNYLLHNRWALFDEQYRYVSDVGTLLISKIITNQFQLFAAINNSYSQLYPIIAEEPVSLPSRSLPLSASSTPPLRLSDASAEHSDSSRRNSEHDAASDGPSSPVIGPGRVFGKPIEEAPANDNHIPIIVQQCVDFMSQTSKDGI